MGHVRICNCCDTHYDNNDKCMCDRLAYIEEGDVFTEGRIKFTHTYENPVYEKHKRGPMFITRNYDYNKITNYCPFCGKNSVWRSNIDVDHYVGADHLCAACCCKFYLPCTGYEINRGDVKVVEEINKLGG